MQIDYLLHEIQTLFKPLWDKLRATASVREASDCVLLQFERPANQSPNKPCVVLHFATTLITLSML